MSTTNLLDPSQNFDLNLAPTGAPCVMMRIFCWFQLSVQILFSPLQCHSESLLHIHKFYHLSVHKPSPFSVLFVRKIPVKDKRKKKIVKEGKTSISVNCYQILKGLKSALGKISGLCRLTKRLSLCAGSWPTSAGRRQPASKVRRWNISQDAHGRISGRSGPFQPQEAGKTRNYQGTSV